MKNSAIKSDASNITKNVKGSHSCSLDKIDVYQMVTNKIVAELEKGVIPWSKPWAGICSGARNYVTGKEYSFLNQMLLGEPGEYITFNQVKDKGGKIRKGAQANFVIFWKMFKRERLNDKGDKVTDCIPTLRYYNVFRIEDVEGIEPHANIVENFDVHPLDAGDKVISEYVARENGFSFQEKISDEAYYSPRLDKVVVPLKNQFPEIEQFYATAFHEITHSTLKESRCNREHDNKNAHFGGEKYSKEELVAEMGSAMLMNFCGIDNDITFNNSVAYIQSWLKVLKNDKKFVVSAAGKAEKAVNYILAVKDN